MPGSGSNTDDAHTGSVSTSVYCYKSRQYASRGIDRRRQGTLGHLKEKQAGCLRTSHIPRRLQNLSSTSKNIMSRLFRTQEWSFTGAMRAFLPSSVRPPCCKESSFFRMHACCRLCSLISSLLRLVAAKASLNKTSRSALARGCRLVSPGVLFSGSTIVSTYQEKFDSLTQAR